MSLLVDALTNLVQGMVTRRSITMAAYLVRLQREGETQRQPKALGYLNGSDGGTWH